MAVQRHLLYTVLVLDTMVNFGDHIIDFAMAINYYKVLTKRQLYKTSHGLAEPLVVHRPGPGHLGEVCRPHHWLFHG